MNLSECFKVLELPENTSPTNLRAAYLELVKVWHPDRFPGDIALQARAQEKLKQINIAYQTILNYWESATAGHRSPSATHELPIPPWSDRAFKLLNKIAQERNIKIEFTVGKLVNEQGETVGVKSFLRRGTSPARVTVELNDSLLDFTSWAFALLRIPINSDTCSNPFRTVFRDIRTVVGAKQRSASMFKGVSELSQSFPLAEGPFRSLKGDEFWSSASPKSSRPGHPQMG